MTISRHRGRTAILLAAVCLAGCGLSEDAAKRQASLGLIITPPSYYTTMRGRYLGEKYRDNLQRVVQRVVENPATGRLQFANNIASLGGIGFFTHSATKTLDERYLEVMVGAPEVFDGASEFNAKLGRLFSQYGPELLSILVADAEILNDAQVAGYGLNFSWRNTVHTATGPRVTLERGVIYVTKPDARRFLSRQLGENELLQGAVVFALEEEGPSRIVSYHPPAASSIVQAPRGQENSERPVDAKAEVTTTLREQDLPSPAKGAKEAAAPAISTARVEQNSTQEQEALKRELEAARERQAREAEAQRLAELKRQEEARRREEAARQAEEKRRLEEARRAEAAKREELKRQETARKEADAAKAAEEAKHREELRRAEVVKKRAAEQLALKTKPQSSDEERKLAPVKSAETPPAAATPAQKETKTEDSGMETVSLKPPAPHISPVPSSTDASSAYVVQFSFNAKGDAQRWSERLHKEGYTTSLTATGEGGSVRLRVGNFPSHAEAARVLARLRVEGIRGIVIQAAN